MQLSHLWSSEQLPEQLPQYCGRYQQGTERKKAEDKPNVIVGLKYQKTAVFISFFTLLM